MSFYNEQRDVITPTSAGSWETVDLSGFNIPASAVVEIVCQHFDKTSTHVMGVRSIGSSIERKLTLSRKPDVSPDGGSEDLTIHVRADPNSRIQTFTDITSANFLLMGHWLDGKYVDIFDSFTASSSGTWEDQDLTSFGVPSGSVVEIVGANSDTSNDRELGIREKGSLLERRLNVRSAIVGGSSNVTFRVNSDANDNNTIQKYVSNISNTTFYLFGYWSVPPGKFIETIDDIGVPSVDNTWENKDLSSFGLNEFSVADIKLSNEESTAFNIMGVREDGSSINRIVALGASDGAGSIFEGYHSSLSGTQVVEIKTDDRLNTSFTLLGYWVKAAESGLNLFISGPVQSTSGLDLYIGGKPSGDLDLFIIASVPLSGETTLFIGGKPSGTLDLFLQVPEPISSGMDLFLSNTFTSDEINLFLAQKTTSGVLSLFEQAALPFPLFARGPDQTVTDALDFIIYGGSGLEFTNDSLAFFLSGALDTSPIISGELFARVATDFPLSTGIVSWPLFANVDGQQRDANINLFINAGANFSGNMDLFTQQDDEDATRIGFTPQSGTFNLFARVPSGSIDSMPMFIDGFFPPSGDINLVISGSVNTIDSNVDLFINGFFPTSSGNVTFFMSDPIGTIDKSKTLFIRGDGC